ncbi:hypothetical protein V1503_23625 [Bacillus sp. SCS-151]|uniref:hypothetical protein n=1 Tax=Nanhaiella sioensis TaxID=3115293 RepID=UPI00397BD2CF
MVEDKNICILSFFDFNKKIRETGLSPRGFKYPYYDDDGDVHSSIMVDFGDWEISNRSDQQYLIFKCPISDGSFQTPLESANLTFKNSWIQIKYELGDIENYFNYILALDITAPVPVSDLPDNPVVVVIDSSYNFSTATDPSRTESECNSLFEKLFSSEGSIISHVLSIVFPDPNVRGEKKFCLKISVDKNPDGETNLERSMISISYI